MRGEWYGDKRDVVKWISLAKLAKFGDRNRRILQVTMNTFDRCNDLKGLDTTDSVTGKVVDHFYNLQDVKRLGETLEVEISVFDKPFVNKIDRRSDYFNAVCERIKEIKKDDAEPIVVFLDPDTGIEPPSGHGKQHVRKCELKRIFNSLKQDDYLACYQHKPLGVEGVQWQSKAQERMKGALAVDCVVRKCASKYKDDVIVLAVLKGSPGSQ